MASTFGFGWGGGRDHGGPSVDPSRGGDVVERGGGNDLSAVFELAAGLPFPGKESASDNLRAISEAWPVVFATVVAAFLRRVASEDWGARERVQVERGVWEKEPTPGGAVDVDSAVHAGDGAFHPDVVDA